MALGEKNGGTRELCLSFKSGYVIPGTTTANPIVSFINFIIYFLAKTFLPVRS